MSIKAHVNFDVLKSQSKLPKTYGAFHLNFNYYTIPEVKCLTQKVKRTSPTLNSKSKMAALSIINCEVVVLSCLLAVLFYLGLITHQLNLMLRRLCAQNTA